MLTEVHRANAIAFHKRKVAWHQQRLDELLAEDRLVTRAMRARRLKRAASKTRKRA